MEKNNEKSLTLDDLAKYSQEFLFPFMKESFIGKKEFDDFKKEMTDFKNENLTGQDKILKDLTVLMQEKTVGDNQDKRQKKVIEIHNDALKSSKILSDKQVSEIDNLRVF